MKEKILIVYSTRTGSTENIALKIKKIFERKNFECDLGLADEIKSLDGYSAAVIGSPIRAGRLSRDIMRFSSKFRNALTRIPTAAFAVCITLREDTEENRRQVGSCLNPLRLYINTLDDECFAGKMDYSKLGMFARFIVKKLVKVPEGDYINYSQVEKWASELSERIVSENRR